MSLAIEEAVTLYPSFIFLNFASRQSLNKQKIIKQSHGRQAFDKAHTRLITKILLTLTLLNVFGDLLAATWLLTDPSLREGSINGSPISNFTGNEGALMITSALLIFYAAVYAVSVFGLFKKLKWALPVIIGVSIVNRALALVIFQPAFGYLIWTTWKIIMIALASYLLRKL